MFSLPENQQIFDFITQKDVNVELPSSAIANSVDINQLDKQGLTLLSYAVSPLFSIKLVSELITKGSNVYVNDTSGTGKTALSVIIQYPYLLKILIEKELSSPALNGCVVVRANQRSLFEQLYLLDRYLPLNTIAHILELPQDFVHSLFHLTAHFIAVNSNNPKIVMQCEKAILSHNCSHVLDLHSQFLAYTERNNKFLAEKNFLLNREDSVTQAIDRLDESFERAYSHWGYFGWVELFWLRFNFKLFVCIVVPILNILFSFLLWFFAPIGSLSTAEIDIHIFACFVIGAVGAGLSLFVITLLGLSFAGYIDSGFRQTFFDRDPIESPDLLTRVTLLRHSLLDTIQLYHQYDLTIPEALSGILRTLGVELAENSGASSHPIITHGEFRETARAASVFFEKHVGSIDEAVTELHATLWLKETLRAPSESLQSSAGILVGESSGKFEINGDPVRPIDDDLPEMGKMTSLSLNPYLRLF